MPALASRTAAALLLAAAACTSVAVSATPALAAPVVAPMHSAAPSVGELQSKLEVLLDTGAPRANRAAELEAGEAGLGMADQIANVVNSVPGFHWNAAGPVNVNGDTLTHQLQFGSPGFEGYSLELSWREIDGAWKLTRESECQLGTYAGVPCSV
ncbi:hypothetical protein [Nocardia wallacei]|uniref:hypothetical protein n=1 Tax=Nocardia wallacei TaxID=480035 RepID=UPI0024550ED8|nr:hypothetical protein [Nocardia wallacei]